MHSALKSSNNKKQIIDQSGAITSLIVDWEDLSAKCFSVNLIPFSNHLLYEAITKYVNSEKMKF